MKDTEILYAMVKVYSDNRRLIVAEDLTYHETLNFREYPLGVQKDECGEFRYVNVSMHHI